MMIAPFKTGLDTDIERWIAPPDSFRQTSNIHVHHGYLEKRSGYYEFSSLSHGERVMGITRYLEADGQKRVLAFDTLNGYILSLSTNTFTMLDSAAPIFDSGEYDYINAVNWQSSNLLNRLYFSNGKAWNGLTDPNSLNGIRYYSSASATSTVLFTPELSNVTVLRKLYGGKLLFTIGQRLIILYTYENDTTITQEFPQRARWCAKQNPDNWNDVVAGGGGYEDAATGDQIVSAQALKNQIIVFFTNSVWSLQPTGLPNPAFRWSRLNNYRACDGIMGSVAYDKIAIGIGTRGITATDGTQTERIDDRIVDFTANNININQIKKLFCFRSYQTQRWWTLYPYNDSTENNQALIYDDESKAFTTYDISLNCLGYNTSFSYALSDFTAVNNLDFSLDEMGEDTLIDWGFDGGEDILLGGDILGNIYQMEIGSEDANTNINASFTTAAWNPYIKEGIQSQMPYIDFYVDTDKKTNGTVEFYINDQPNPYTTQSINFLPNLDFVAAITSVSNSNPCVIFSPNHGLVTGQEIFIYGATGMQELNSSGYTVTVINSSSFSLNGIDSTAYGVWEGGGNVYLKEFYQTKAWIRVYGGGIGYTHWIKVSLNGGEKPFRFHALKPSFRKRGNRCIT
jgi:hypothetical protein